MHLSRRGFRNAKGGGGQDEKLFNQQSLLNANKE